MKTKAEHIKVIVTAPKVLDEREAKEEALLREICDIIPTIEMDELKRLYRQFENNMERLL